MKYTKLALLLFCWVVSLNSMAEYIANELAQESKDQVVKKLGGKDRCDTILAQWSQYEKQLLATALHEPTWPSIRGHSIPFAKSKEIYRDCIITMIEGKKIRIEMQDFAVLAELHNLPTFADYSEEMLKFANLHENHFEKEDDVWEQLNRLLTRGK